MLRLCVILSVLFGLQVKGADNRSADLCKSLICLQIDDVIVHNDYKEYHVPDRQVLYTVVDGMDLKNATNVALEKFFRYSQFDNTAGTIVPITAPWSVFVPFENGKMTRPFSFYIEIPNEVQDPPNPIDQTVHYFKQLPNTVYVREFEQADADYEKAVSEFRAELDKDQRRYYSSGVYIGRYNTGGFFHIAFLRE